MPPNSNLYIPVQYIAVWIHFEIVQVHPATPSLGSPCRLSAVMIEAHVTQLSVAWVAPNIETMVCGDPQEGSTQNHHAPEHRWPETAAA